MQTDSEYYYSYSYEHMIRLINTALSEAMIKLKLLVGSAIDTVDPPYLVWNVDWGSASLYAFADNFNQNNFPQIKIYFNRPLYFLFSSMHFIKMSHSISKNRNYLIVVYPYFTENIGIDTYIRVDQEYTVVACWSPISSIVLYIVFTCCSK